MTDKQKLQALFDAALKSPVDFAQGVPQRAFPTPSIETAPAVAAALPIPDAPATAVSTPLPAEVLPPAPAPQAPALDAAAAAELGVLLDEQILRRKRRRRIEALVTAILFFGSAAGGTLWFVQDGTRVQAFKEAIRDIRSVGDVKSLVAKYQDSLDRIAARGRQIDQATAALGVKPSDGTEEDPYLEAEMKQMMGEDGGKTVGQRNRALQQSFAQMAKENGGTLKARPDALKGKDAPPDFEFK